MMRFSEFNPPPINCRWCYKQIITISLFAIQMKYRGEVRSVFIMRHSNYGESLSLSPFSSKRVSTCETCEIYESGSDNKMTNRSRRAPLN